MEVSRSSCFYYFSYSKRRSTLEDLQGAARRGDTISGTLQGVIVICTHWEPA
jgi:hypothetical protein